MNRNLLKLIVACGATCFIACTAPQKAETEKWSERMARSEMKRFPEPWMIEKAKKPRWGYTHGLVVKSMLEEWKHTGDSTYYEYAKIYAVLAAKKIVSLNKAILNYNERPSSLS